MHGGGEGVVTFSFLKFDGRREDRDLFCLFVELISY